SVRLAVGSPRAPTYRVCRKTLLALQIILLDVVFAALVELDATSVPALGLVERRAIHRLEEIDDGGVGVHHHRVAGQAVPLAPDLAEDLVGDGGLGLNLAG